MKWKNFYQPDTVYFFSSRITEKIHILRKPAYKQIVMEALLKYLIKYQAPLHAYVIMDNHFHLFLSAAKAHAVQYVIQNTLRQSGYNIARTLESYLDSPYAKQANEVLAVFARHANGKSKYAVWKEQARGIAMQTHREFDIRLRYLHENPVRAGLAERVEDYPYSSFRGLFYGEESFLPVMFPASELFRE
ncbi:MAG: hypothetical protein GY862_26115 [Gammaproteobacteria bacterium]|nr:hypothetical protein [Gammaproteobacteria bacterium]